MALDYTKEVKKDVIIRDPRSFRMKFKDSFESRIYTSLWCAGAFGAACLMPIGGELAMGAMALMMGYGIKRQNNIKMPASKPQSSGLPHADGRVYLGNDRRTKLELNLSNRQTTTHTYFLGTTGAGKTEFLLSYGLNFLIQGSSFSMIDGKGSAGLFHAVSSLARYYSREEDLLLVNFLSGPKDIMGAQRSKISNEFNTLNRLSATAASQLLIAVSTPEQGGGDVWDQRKQSFLENLCPPLIFLRDNYKFNLDANSMRNFFTLDAIEKLMLVMPFMYDGLLPYLQGLAMYIENIPGWDITKSLQFKSFITEMKKPDNAKTRRDFERLFPNYVARAADYLSGAKSLDEANLGSGHSQEVTQQQGFITMQLTRLFGSLADVYGYIMRSLNSEIDTTDVILHRRIWITLLPALSKSMAEVRNLGNFSLSSIRQAMSIGLGYEMEGTAQDVIESAATNAPAPKAIFADECNAYIIDGTFVIPAQARSLGIAMTFAGQDIAGLERAVDKEAGSILGNTPTKFCGKIDDEKVAEYLDKQFGEARFLVNNDYENFGGQGTGSTVLVESDKWRVETLKRIGFEDLKRQTVGHWHYFYNLDIYHIKSFYANTKLAPALRVMHFLSVTSFYSIEGRAVDNSMAAINNVLHADLNEELCLSDLMDEYRISNGDSNIDSSSLNSLAGFESSLLQLNRFNDKKAFEHLLAKKDDERAWDPITPFMPAYSIRENVLSQQMLRANTQTQLSIVLDPNNDTEYLRKHLNHNYLQTEMRLLIAALIFNNGRVEALTSATENRIERGNKSAKLANALKNLSAQGSGIYIQNNAILSSITGKQLSEEQLEAMKGMNEAEIEGINNEYSKSHSSSDKFEVSQLSSIINDIVNQNPKIYKKGEFVISAFDHSQ